MVWVAWFLVILQVAPNWAMSNGPPRHWGTESTFGLRPKPGRVGAPPWTQLGTLAVTTSGQSWRQRRSSDEVAEIWWYLNAQCFRLTDGRYAVTSQLILPEGYPAGRIQITAQVLNEHGRGMMEQKSVLHLQATVTEKVLHDVVIVAEEPARLSVTLGREIRVGYHDGSVRERTLTVESIDGPGIAQFAMLHSEPVPMVRLNDIRCHNAQQLQTIRAIDPLYRGGETLLPAFQSHVRADLSAQFLIQIQGIDEPLGQSHFTFSFDSQNSVTNLPIRSYIPYPFQDRFHLYLLEIDASEAMGTGSLTVSVGLPYGMGRLESRMDTLLSQPQPLQTKRLNERLLRACREPTSIHDIRHLLAAGADAFARDRDGNGVFSHAAIAGRHGVMPLLAELGAPIDLPNRDGQTALMVASAHGKLAALRQLIKLGADMTLSDDRGYSALHHACRANREAEVRLLLGAGADPTQVNAVGRSGLMEAVSHADLKTIRLFRIDRANMDAIDKYGFGLMHLLAMNPNINKKMVRYLIDQGLSVDSRNQGGRTPLMLSAAFGLKRSVAAYLPFVENLEQTDHAGETALMLAAVKGEVNVGRLLLKAGADPHLSNRGINALMLAAANGRLDFCELLIRVTDVEREDERGWTAEDYARDGGHQQVLALFAKLGR